MSQSLSEKNIPRELFHNVPSNRGYIIDGKRNYGGSELTNKGSDVVMIDSDRHLHVWLRRGYLEKELNANDTDWDCWTSTPRQRLVTSHSMRPCPAELENRGMCLDRFDPEHRKYFYHFANYKRGTLVVKDGLVRCKYHCKGDKWQCWEKHNGGHAKVFYHED